MKWPTEPFGQVICLAGAQLSLIPDNQPTVDAGNIDQGQDYVLKDQRRFTVLERIYDPYYRREAEYHKSVAGQPPAGIDRDHDSGNGARRHGEITQHVFH